MEVIVYVQDMGKQVAFYRDALGLKVTFPQGVTDFKDQFWVTFDTGISVLALHAGSKGRLGEDSPKFVFRVADIQAARAELLKRGVLMGEVRTPAPGISVCDGKDPEGNAFSIESRS
jgi:catechol 2,3-dioxygenase-like lactoylglutathione lyase family enzyme